MEKNPAQDTRAAQTRCPTWDEEQEFGRLCIAGNVEEITERIRAADHNIKLLNHGLEVAIGRGQPEVADLLMNSGACVQSIIPFPPEDHTAIPMYETLLKHGWNINQRLGHYGTYLMRALGDETLVRWFLDHGATVKNWAGEAHQTDSGTDYLTLAACVDSIATFDLLLEHGASKEGSLPLHAAAMTTQFDRRDMMSHLIDLGFDVNANDDLGIHRTIGTPLRYAVVGKATKHACFLLERGADPDISLGRGGSSLELAEWMGLTEVADACRQARNRHSDSSLWQKCTQFR